MMHISRAFVFLCLLALAKGWILTVSHKHVAVMLTRQITFSCYYDDNDNGLEKLQTISRMRIMKLSENRKWEQVAKISPVNEKITTSLTSAAVGGHAGLSSESFLNISFPVATDETVGTFQCNVDGYDTNDNVEVVTTAPVQIELRGISKEDMLGMLDRFKVKENKDYLSDALRIGLLEKVVQGFQPLQNSRTARLSAMRLRILGLSSHFLQTTNGLLKQQKNIKAEIDDLKRNVLIKNTAWPEGVYTMLNTTDGCPQSSTFDWQTSSFGISTQAANIAGSSTSNSFHMAMSDIGSNNVVTLNSCSKVTTSYGPAWPKGNYCLQAYASTGVTRCPVNFKYGQITFDRFNAPGSDPVVNLPNIVVDNDVTRVGYCCRNDGPTSHPIVLPTAKPFYLYRFGGQCQEVSAMDVTEEWVSIATLGAKDKYLNAIHPDGQINNVILQLCYYVRRY